MTATDPDSGVGRTVDAAGTSRLALVGFLAKNKMVTVTVSYLVFLIVLLAIADLLPVNPLSQDLRQRFLPPLGMDGGGLQYLLGTDNLGRSVMARLLFGARLSVGVGVATALVAMFIGVGVGMMAGIARGWVHEVLSRLIDMWMGLPLLLVALLFLYTFGGGVFNVVLVIGLVRWVVFARLTRALVLSLRESLFIEATHSIGAPKHRILLRHMVPNMRADILMLVSLEIARAMLAEASLSFLGLGVQSPDASWGTMLADARSYVSSWPLGVVFPGVAILMTTLSINVATSQWQALRQGKVRFDI